MALTTLRCPQDFAAIWFKNLIGEGIWFAGNWQRLMDLNAGSLTVHFTFS